jgi:phosphoadenosine phosphosulfate reductase
MKLSQVSEQIKGMDLIDSMSLLCDLHPGKVIFTSSFGIEDQVISHLIFENDLPVKVITLDTGRLFEETYKVFSNTLKKYGKQIHAYYPDGPSLEKLLTEKGPYSFYESIDARKECCNIRKVEPLNRSLDGMAFWITGIRGDQSAGRTDMTNLEEDKGRDIIKYHPLFDWTLDDVENFLKDNNVPYNSLHDKGFISIGCAPCTRAVKEGEDFRSGRWWWENHSGKECGLHK